jgi:hypothetical protein
MNFNIGDYENNTVGIVPDTAYEIQKSSYI